VWSLAAIAYESLSGRVPFTGNNGPAILLEILTKEPMPVSNAAKGRKHQIPPTVDRVMVHAFKKSAAMRIGSVGALADALGDAYGLSGDHNEWSATTQAELGQRIASKLPELMHEQGRPTAMDMPSSSFFGGDALEVAPDPFAAPAPAVAPQPLPAGQVAPAAAVPMSPGEPYGSQTDDLVAMGVPKGGMGWVIAVAVGGFALLLIVVVVILVV
jgi:serine/threonine-protein kinase